MGIMGEKVQMYETKENKNRENNKYVIYFLYKNFGKKFSYYS